MAAAFGLNKPEKDKPTEHSLEKSLPFLPPCLVASLKKVPPGREEPQINNLIPREIWKVSHFLNYNWQE